MKKNTTLSKTKLKVLLNLFKYVVSQKSKNKSNALAYLDNNSIDNISESIYNFINNEKLNLFLSKSHKNKLKRIVRPSLQTYEVISKRQIPVTKRKTKVIQMGSGIGTILLTLIPMLTSLLSRK